MKKIRFYLIFDSFFIFTALFFTLYALLKYNGLRFLIALFVSSLFSAILTLIFTILIILKSDKKLSDFEEKEYKKALANYLSFLDESEVLALFLTYYSHIFKDAKIENGKIVLTKIKTCVFPIFTMEKLTTKEVINAYKNTKKGYKTKILYNNATSEVLLLSQSLKIRIELFDINSVYFCLKNNELLPSLEIPKKPKIKLLPIFKNLFKKQKAGKFLLFGVLTLLFSTVTFFPLYYVLFGLLLIIIAIVLKFFAPFESTKNIEL